VLETWTELTFGWTELIFVILKRNEIEPFLKRMITDDEKWITYDNPTRKRSWIKKGEKAIAKPGLTRKKVMLCVWWEGNRSL